MRTTLFSSSAKRYSAWLAARLCRALAVGFVIVANSAFAQSIFPPVSSNIPSYIISTIQQNEIAGSFDFEFPFVYNGNYATILSSSIGLHEDNGFSPNPYVWVDSVTTILAGQTHCAFVLHTGFPLNPQGLGNSCRPWYGPAEQDSIYAYYSFGVHSTGFAKSFILLPVTDSDTNI